MEIKKKVVAGLAATLSAAMLFSVAACGGDSGASDAPDDGSLMKVDVFSSTANYQGVQKGWFAKIVKDKFNMELNTSRRTWPVAATPCSTPVRPQATSVTS